MGQLPKKLDFECASDEFRVAVQGCGVKAIGHAKNPRSHRDVTMAPDEAARLIIFGSYLLDIVERRSGA